MNYYLIVENQISKVMIIRRLLKFFLGRQSIVVIRLFQGLFYGTFFLKKHSKMKKTFFFLGGYACFATQFKNN